MLNWHKHVCDQVPPLGVVMIKRQDGRCQIGDSTRFDWVIPKGTEDISEYVYMDDFEKQIKSH